jgi:NTP pyrophosphatase (non-canonical NTP hydrolase)
MLASQKSEHVHDELADVLMGCILLADVLKIDLLACLDKKIDKTAAKYPLEKARGNSKKYTEYTE